MSPSAKPNRASGSGSSRVAATRKAGVFTEEERAAMRDKVKEARGSINETEGEGAVLAKIATFKGEDRAMAQRLHAIVKASAPSLSPRLWYGMPAYSKDGKVLCFFQPAAKFKTRYATFGFSDKAGLDDGSMWPVGFALKGLSAADEARIAALIAKAAK